MSSEAYEDVGSDVLRALEADIDELFVLPVTGLGDDELLAQIRARERVRRRLAAADHALIAELETRAVASAVGYASTAKLLTAVVRIAPAEAAARVRAAALLGPRIAVSGECLTPAFPAVAAVQACGQISDRHASIITDTIRDLPQSVRDVHGEEVEVILTEHAERLNPAALAQAAQRITALLDADGTLADEADRVRRRGLTLTRHRDGSSTLAGRLTPELAEKLSTATDAAAAPRPADGSAISDVRSPAQRLHDAVEDVLDVALTSGQLRPSGGMPAAVLVTMTLDQLEGHTGRAQTGAGSDLVSTGHGGLLTVDAALRLADQARVALVVTDRDGGRVLALTTQHRAASTAQRFALAARDGGCSFPDCTVPAAWTQAHHVVEWSKGGPTSLDNLTLVCGFHHRNFERNGWSCRMSRGTAQWMPPAFIDPARRPRSNTAHRVDIDRLQRDIACVGAELKSPA